MSKHQNSGKVTQIRTAPVIIDERSQLCIQFPDQLAGDAAVLILYPVPRVSDSRLLDDLLGFFGEHQPDRDLRGRIVQFSDQVTDGVAARVISDTGWRQRVTEPCRLMQLSRASKRFVASFSRASKKSQSTPDPR
jgi:hypothetical protein